MGTRALDERDRILSEALPLLTRIIELGKELHEIGYDSLNGAANEAAETIKWHHGNER